MDAGGKSIAYITQDNYANLDLSGSGAAAQQIQDGAPALLGGGQPGTQETMAQDSAHAAMAEQEYFDESSNFDEKYLLERANIYTSVYEPSNDYIKDLKSVLNRGRDKDGTVKEISFENIRRVEHADELKFVKEMKENKNWAQNERFRGKFRMYDASGNPPLSPIEKKVLERYRIFSNTFELNIKYIREFIQHNYFFYLLAARVHKMVRSHLTLMTPPNEKVFLGLMDLGGQGLRDIFKRIDGAPVLATAPTATPDASPVWALTDFILPGIYERLYANSMLEMKVPLLSDKRDSSLLREAVVAMYATNALKEFTPNIAFCVAAFKAPVAALSDDESGTTLKLYAGTEFGTYIVRERLYDSSKKIFMSFKEFYENAIAQSVDSEELVSVTEEIITQVLLTISAMAGGKIALNDLNVDKITISRPSAHTWKDWAWSFMAGVGEFDLLYPDHANPKEFKHVSTHARVIINDLTSASGLVLVNREDAGEGITPSALEELADARVLTRIREDEYSSQKKYYLPVGESNHRFGFSRGSYRQIFAIASFMGSFLEFAKSKDNLNDVVQKLSKIISMIPGFNHDSSSWATRGYVNQVEALDLNMDVDALDLLNNLIASKIIEKKFRIMGNDVNDKKIISNKYYERGRRENALPIPRDRFTIYQFGFVQQNNDYCIEMLNAVDQMILNIVSTVESMKNNITQDQANEVVLASRWILNKIPLLNAYRAFHGEIAGFYGDLSQRTKFINSILAGFSSQSENIKDMAVADGELTSELDATIRGEDDLSKQEMAYKLWLNPNDDARTFGPGNLHNKNKFSLGQALRTKESMSKYFEMGTEIINEILNS
jgi:hypothetical protein